MRNWKLEPFNGTLLQIIEDCAAWLPPAYHLINTQRWLIEQLQSAEDNPAVLLPVRRFKGRDERGAAFELDGCRFVPVDNEPATALYELVRLNGSKVVAQTSLQGLIRSGTLPVSWQCDLATDENRDWRFGQARAEFRSMGLKLAHIFDAGQKSLSRATADGCLPRFFRTMNPANHFPFPGVKEVKFGGDLEGDVAENPIVQSILRGFMMDYLDDAEAISDWLHFSDVTLTEQQLRKSWKLEAHSIQLTIANKRGEDAPRARGQRAAVDEAGDDGVPVPQMPGAKSAVGLKQLAQMLADWVELNPDADIRLDGKASGGPGNRSGWIFFRVQHFTGEHQEWNGVYRFHGDTEIQPIRELLNSDNWARGGRPGVDEIVESIRENLQPAWTRSKNRSLVLKNHTKPDGFYCFQV